MNSDFREKLLQGDVLVGTLITIASAEVAEILAAVGFDWLFVDTEHSAFNAYGAQRVLQAAGRNCPCVVRVPANDDVWIKKALDIGASGIIAPQVNTAADAEAIVRMCKYPPDGTRGVGIGRAHTYGLAFNEYMARANDEIAVILQAETHQALNNISEIVKVPGIDAIFIGPYDLSASLGKMGQLTDPEVMRAMDTIATACQSAGVRLGVFAAATDGIKPYLQQGYTLLAVGTDGLHMAQSAGDTLKALK
ncbi:MAG: aldolase/citrate lyase family protein [Deltaproteobacteria bacterium]|nr:aldolase/citrate lyase family protein [Deltaproteobacteria bacterium]